MMMNLGSEIFKLCSCCGRKVSVRSHCFQKYYHSIQSASTEQEAFTDCIEDVALIEQRVVLALRNAAGSWLSRAFHVAVAVNARTMPMCPIQSRPLRQDAHVMRCFFGTKEDPAFDAQRCFGFICPFVAAEVCRSRSTSSVVKRNIALLQQSIENASFI